MNDRTVRTVQILTSLLLFMLYNFSALKTVALNYGVFRRKDFNTTHKYYMFYDMGAHSTTATVVGKLLKILFFSIFCINNLEI